MNKMRLFIAIKFSPEIERILTDLQSNMKESGIIGNYTSRQNLHLTLAFIGEYNDPGIVMETLRKVIFKPFRLTLEEKTGNFGDILWVGIQKNAVLMSLDQKIRKALDDYGIHYDRKTFRPHITIIRKARVYSKHEKYINEIMLERGTMIVERFSLMQSQRIEGKLVYTELDCVNAKGVIK